MELLFLRQALVLAGTALAAYADIKTGLIFDRITYPMIALGVIFNLIEFDLNAFLVAGMVFAVGFALYYFGKIGGGDVKLFTGTALLMPFLNGTVFILSVLIVAGITAVVFLAVFYVMKYARKGIDWKFNSAGIRKSIFLGVVLVVYFYFLVSAGIAPISYAVALGIPMVFALAFLALERGIRKEFFLEEVKIGELEEDDILASDFLKEEEANKINAGMKGVIDKKLQERIKALGFNKVKVYRNLPKFAPFVFLGVVASIAWPEVLNAFLM